SAARRRVRRRCWRRRQQAGLRERAGAWWSCGRLLLARLRRTLTPTPLPRGEGTSTGEQRIERVDQPGREAPGLHALRIGARGIEATAEHVAHAAEIARVIVVVAKA